MTANVDRLASELPNLSTESLLEVRDALHSLKSVRVHSAISSILWAREGRPAEGWPQRAMEPADDISYVVVAYHDWRERGGKPAQNHDGHACSAVLEISGRDTEYRCQCGASTDNGMAMRWRRSSGAPIGVWPVRIVDGIPHYRICRYAVGADDVHHGTAAGGECLCGAYFLNDPDSSAKLLPAY